MRIKDLENVADTGFGLLVAWFPIAFTICVKVFRVQKVSRVWESRGRLTTASVLLLAWVGMVAPVQAADPGSMDHLRAAYLYQFTKFVGWNSVNEGSLVIALVGQDPLRGAEDTIIGKRSQGRVVEVVPLHVDARSEQRCCDVIYGRPEALAQLRVARPKLFGEGVLVVSDGAKEVPPLLAADRWRTIYMYTENDKLRFDVDLAGAASADLTLGSELLKNAAAVYRGANAP